VLQMQQALQGHVWPGGEQVRVRMGIHCGEAAKTATGLGRVSWILSGWAGRTLSCLIVMI